MVILYTLICCKKSNWLKKTKNKLKRGRYRPYKTSTLLILAIFNHNLSVTQFVYLAIYLEVPFCTDSLTTLVAVSRSSDKSGRSTELRWADKRWYIDGSRRTLEHKRWKISNLWVHRWQSKHEFWSVQIESIFSWFVIVTRPTSNNLFFICGHQNPWFLCLWGILFKMASRKLTIHW